LLCLASYIKVKIKYKLGQINEPKSLEDWVVYNFGGRLYLAFFKTYTEKVWGIPCSEIAADWAVQRIKGLSLKTAATSMLRSFLQGKAPRRGSKQIKTLITSFTYPRLGPGMMWEAAAELVRANGGRMFLGAKVTSLDHDEEKGLWYLKVADTSNNQSQESGSVTDAKRFGPYDHVISSAPLSSVIPAISKPLPSEALAAANSLGYRDFMLIALILKESSKFSDQWLYIHDPGFKVGRIQNFQNWSPELVDDSGLVCYGMEYFCFQGDVLWNKSDEELIALATRELVELGLALPGDVVDGCVVKQPRAYPVYDDKYQGHIDTIKGILSSHCPGLHQVGRNGMHRYNNQDHSMMTAMLTVRNILNQDSRYDPWLVKQDAEYIEDSKDEAVKS
jgi:protoporphyrinogen oxidase